MKTKLKKTERYIQQNRLARYCGKKYGEFLLSGTLALELALKCAEVKKGDYVLIPNGVCYRVLWSVVRNEAIPIIVTPKNGLVLQDYDVKKALKDYPIKAIILVHNMGIRVDVKKIREICPKQVVIIEDIAQMWQAKAQKRVDGASDYVVTSFGARKALGLGIGGAIFANNELFRSFLDDYSSVSRESKRVQFPYILPEKIKIDVDMLLRKANKKLAKQKMIADCLISELKNSNFKFWDTNLSEKMAWHRFPIWTDDKKLFERAKKLAKDCRIEYELPYKLTLDRLPLAIGNNAIYIDNTVNKYYYINIKTRLNLLKNIKKWSRLIK